MKMNNEMKRPYILSDEYQNFDKHGMSDDEVSSVIYSSYCQDLEEYCNEIERENKTIKKAFELSCEQLYYFQDKLLDLEKQITHLVRKYGCHDSVYPISSEKWQKRLLDAVECFEKEYEAHYLDKNCEEKENGK